jgi:hypothetical protein
MDSAVSLCVSLSKLVCLSEPEDASLLRNLSFSRNLRFVMFYSTGHLVWFYSGATTFSITTLSLPELSITRLSMMTFITMTLSRKGLSVILSINDGHHNSTLSDADVVMLSLTFFIACRVPLFSECQSYR